MKKEYTLNNGFVFEKIFSDNENAKYLIEKTLNMKVEDVNFLHSEIHVNSGRRIVSMFYDVHTKDGHIKLNINHDNIID